MSSKIPRPLPYDPSQLSRELAPFYIPATKKDWEKMGDTIGISNEEELFAHIPSSLKFSAPPVVGPSLPYFELIDHLEALSKKNHVYTSFIGDGLKNYQVPEIVSFVAQIRGLLTAYTPYQPERSQGTLNSLWIYSSLLSMLTGFEAINASLYDRSTCLFEALQCAKRNSKKGFKALVLGSLYPGDLEVLSTMCKGTDLEIQTVQIDPELGTVSAAKVRECLERDSEQFVALAFPQVNSLGHLEDIDALTDLCYEFGIHAVAVIDPMLLASDGLKPPSQFGTQKQGTHMIVGEGQHLALAPYFGGPGLGIFGVRHKDKNSAMIRSTPGRFVGQAKDIKGRTCKTLVLSTREQHIRREKATSNICSNQSFVATLAGAALLQRGDAGMTKACLAGRNLALLAARKLMGLPDVDLAFPQTPFYNEFVLSLPVDVDQFIKEASREASLHVGVNVSQRVKKGRNNLLLLSFFDVHSEEDVETLVSYFIKKFGSPSAAKEEKCSTLPCFQLPSHSLRQDPANLPHFSLQQLKEFYEKLGEQNISPDKNIYPLGSCTMKYNPYLHEYVTGFPGWQHIHPQAPVEDTQGCLQVLFEIQEMFKAITGLDGVTTQPMAGAQGELVGLKMFQAYHEDRGEKEQRQIVLIPQSAHGTNPASATVAGLSTKVVNSVVYGIVEIRADARGMMDFDHLKELVQQHGRRILGVMVTNPNTCGLFEIQFKEMSDLIHDVGGLVYMDGANMNAIAGHVNLKSMGVDAVHNNLHKTWTIPHGGGGPGDAIVAVSERLLPYLPGLQIVKNSQSGSYDVHRPAKSIGSVHRHFGNFAHKIRCYAYLKALGTEGVRTMSSFAVLSARYLFHKLTPLFPTLPEKAQQVPRMHEFIITLSPDLFQKIESAGIPKAQVIMKIGKLFLDFGIHTPTVAFPETFGLMIEPTESYTKDELDRFVDVIKAIHLLITETPEVLLSVPHFTPVDRIDEVTANKNLVFSEQLETLPEVHANRISPEQLSRMDVGTICKEILMAHKLANSPSHL